MSATRGTELLDGGVIQGHLSELSYAEGKLDDAIKYGKESLRIYTLVQAPNHRIAEAYTNLGNAEIKGKKFRKALNYYQCALKLRDKLSAGHYQLAVNEGSIAEALVGMRHYDEAMVHVREAERLLGHSSAQNREAHAWILMVHGEALLGQSKPRKAITLLRQALSLCEGAPDQSNEACIKWALARALRLRGRSSGRAQDLAKEARTLFATLGPHEQCNCLAIDEFLKPPDDSGGGGGPRTDAPNGGHPSM